MSLDIDKWIYSDETTQTGPCVDCGKSQKYHELDGDFYECNGYVAGPR